MSELVMNYASFPLIDLSGNPCERGLAPDVTAQPAAAE
jgi:hypothetical protein